MIPAGRITSIWRYPVKSMLGERLAQAQIGELGLHADRTWAVRDVELDATTSAKRLPGLLLCTARYAHPPPPDSGPGRAPEVIIAFPDGTEIPSSDPAVHQALSRYLNREVELRPLPPLDRRDQYRGPMATKTDLRTVFGLEDGEPLPDLSMFPVRKLADISRYATPVGSYVDAYPVHVITEQSLATVAALAPDSDFDVRRFRPTIVVDSPGASPQPEWEWCGGRLRAPHAELQPLIPTIRCVMPSHEQPELKRDKEITRTIAAHSRRCLGVYGNITQAGQIAEGDVLQLDPPNRSAAGSGATKVKRALMRAVSAAIPTGKRS
ncbi:MOSC N-terminal beta barrel domain-containing protein [Mycobacterium sp. CVI_P3]|uniref:MOSC N-terminal beta barrel domain-containing protein n=1 Tax=Mycobacterium pinniadriaticum TaxID=2994102 RepID=A0ABT3S9V5_9MYCO|nr:MOSC N-terminal beta barrel domain-containing protein [Mycobacterium pinniadriaticum]MCX2929510.1 MOSC N-terminal beta barrel domain-containing protein [Mycobacterium pinniadriaticum]MCX2935934.1 MOSC N-terminal beta barrel domain-containing protein [Mycobacterium pinniadriaticum]